MLVATIAVVLVAGIVAAGAVLTTRHQTAQVAASATASAAREASASASAERAANARASAAARRTAQALAEQEAANAEVDEWMNTETGHTWEVIESGNVYVRFADPDEYHCGMLDSTSVVAYARLGCPTSLYVKASVLDAGGTVIGFANDLLGAVPADGSAQALLEDTTGQVETFTLTEVTCR
ncbi:hypothetical protein [Cellulomonas oligotrophica]|uniref:Type II secretory pathway pseudopilin PulG n=1 Tax=Cellulomonas oligotrophica TaxID=931536 RepID=A0A7Y9FCR1_9CELL|nr:hypothetical protein [Cellulomonas oligotrophica]NYD84734.1 type II secretory pathway pseudopilin PulG [Cellulomonas oligotrophica]